MWLKTHVGAILCSHRDSRKRIDALIEEHIERMPQATYNKIVLKASKVLMGEFLLRNDRDPHHLLSLEELKPVFDRCNQLNFPTSVTK